VITNAKGGSMAKAVVMSVLGLSMACVVLLGCATMSDVLASKNEGTVKVYPVSRDRAWDIAMTVLRWEGAETIEEHKSDNYMLTTVGANLISAGSVVGVWVEPAQKGSSQVTIVTKRKMQTNIATGLTETTFHERYAQAVEIVKSGRPLPANAP
jgi:hypothetical protein